MLRIGVDTGGTFTDFVLLNEQGLVVNKVRSTPDDPSRAILSGLVDLGGADGGADVVHGSTVATNAVLERKGARVALVTTAGFEDVLRIGRQTRSELYNFLVPDRRPLVESGRTYGLRERMAADGTPLIAVDPDEVDRLAAALVAAQVDVVAVCLLHSYGNPAHELAVEARLAAAGLTVTLSHRVLPEYREFERWSTTVVNAYVTPLMARYLTALEQKLAGSGLSIMQSNGGSISAAAAKATAVQTILSGPSAGVVGARAVARAAGFPRIIGFDMGGTSTDVSLVDGDVGVTMESTVGDFPIRLPIIDIHTVGAGGGSIAYVDAGGALRVGPRSAGADPGPVCYGRGSELTVTDANLLLGRLDPDSFFGGKMALDVDRTAAIARVEAKRLGCSPAALAEGIVKVANANMERAIRVVSVQRGYDPRDFALLAFGGAGGMHACEIAATLNIDTVLAPRHAGVLSALGMLLADVTKDYSLTILRPADQITLEEILARCGPLVEQAADDLAAEGFSGDRTSIERSLDVRYVGQSYEITLPLTAGFRAEFDRLHARAYGYANPARPTEIVNLRVRATGITAKPVLPQARVVSERQAVPRTCRDARFGGRVVQTGIFQWEDLTPGCVGQGPAVIGGAEATVVIPTGFQFRIDGFGNVIAERMAKAPARQKRQRQLVAEVV